MEECSRSCMESKKGLTPRFLCLLLFHVISLFYTLRLGVFA